MEEVGLANAIKEGRKNKFVNEDTILNLLEGKVVLTRLLHRKDTYKYFP